MKTPVRVKHQATQTEKSPQITRQEADEEKKDEVTMTKKNTENSVTDNDLKEMIEQVFKKFITESNQNKDTATSMLAATETVARD